MDADLQDSPEEIPPNSTAWSGKKAMTWSAAGKRKRFDPLSKTLPSRFFNRRHPAHFRDQIA